MVEFFFGLESQGFLGLPFLFEVVELFGVIFVELGIKFGFVFHLVVPVYRHLGYSTVTSSISSLVWTLLLLGLS